VVSFLYFIISLIICLYSISLSLLVSLSLICIPSLQPDALALGRTAEQLLEAEPFLEQALVAHRTFPGNRPSLSLLFPQLTAFAAGQMLALYEHRTAVQAS